MRRIVIAVAVATAASSLASQAVANDTPMESKTRRSAGGINADITTNAGTGMSKAVSADAFTVKQGKNKQTQRKKLGGKHIAGVKKQ
jgi:hypothetical protein